MKKPEKINEIVHVQKLGVGHYKFISFDENFATASEDLADALNDLVEQFKKVQPLYSKDTALIDKAIEALKKAGYTE